MILYKIKSKTKVDTAFAFFPTKVEIIRCSGVYCYIWLQRYYYDEKISCSLFGDFVTKVKWINNGK